MKLSISKIHNHLCLRARKIEIKTSLIYLVFWVLLAKPCLTQSIYKIGIPLIDWFVYTLSDDFISGMLIPKELKSCRQVSPIVSSIKQTKKPISYSLNYKMYLLLESVNRSQWSDGTLGYIILGSKNYFLSLWFTDWSNKKTDWLSIFLMVTFLQI